ncbi:MAG TPA: hypothetical protein VFE09_06385 [Rubrobacteraceae bacterium]|nr:hypothetical protein [Rubrobacteraceae bacterium]
MFSRQRDGRGPRPSRPEGEARAAYEKGIRQAEKFGHSGMAEDLRLALVELGDRGPRTG